MRLCILSIFHLVVLANFSWAEQTKQTNTYSFGIVPQQSAKRLAELWTPVLKYVSDKSGIQLKFKTAKNIPEFEKRLSQGEYDFAYMNPYHFTVFNRDPGYRALVVRKSQPIHGIIVVHKDSKFNDLKNLINKKLAFPSPAAFAASVLPRAELTNQGISFSAHYVSSHDSVYMGVAKGLFTAGGGVKRTFNNMPYEIRTQLKVLWVSQPFTPHAIATHPRIDQKIYQILQEAFVNMSSDPEGFKLLRSLKIKSGLQKADDKNWDDIKSLGIDLLDRLINQ